MAVNTIDTQNIVDVEDWLKKVEDLEELIESKLAERAQLWALATKITADIDDMPHGTEISDKVGNIVVKLRTWAEESTAIIEQYIAYKKEVINALEQLPLNEYKVLHRLYIRHLSITDIAEDIGYSKRHTERIKQNGLKILKDGTQCR